MGFYTNSIPSGSDWSGVLYSTWTANCNISKRVRIVFLDQHPPVIPDPNVDEPPLVKFSCCLKIESHSNGTTISHPTHERRVIVYAALAGFQIDAITIGLVGKHQSPWHDRMRFSCITLRELFRLKAD